MKSERVQKLLSFSLLIAAFYSSQLDALAVTFPLRGTLVVTVPSRQGLIVAADSRGNFGPAGHCDNIFKVIEPIKPARIAASVVGNAQFFDAPKPNDNLVQCLTLFVLYPRRP